MSAPRVSVLMPVRDGEAHIAEAVESILAQTLGDFELLVVDDGSTDRTSEIVASFGRRDPRVRLLTANGRGLVAALNTGCDAAASDFVARMDADDVAVDARLERQWSELSARPHVAALGSTMLVMNEQGVEVGRWDYPVEPAEVESALGQGNPLAHPSVMFRRSAVQSVGGYRTAFVDAEDYDLWVRLSVDHELANVPDALLRYRLHERQVTIGNLEQQVVSKLAARALSTRDEPMALPERIDRAFLTLLGVGQEIVDHELARAAATWADLMLAAGRPNAAVHALEDARQRVRDRRDRALVDRRRARIALHTGSPAAAAKATLGALAGDPAVIARKLRSLVLRSRP